eukprot:CAMPEP_0177598678 /NCGR_PEP_ID=MMETSP0419_2-20121207/12508_1 /TAXON_ID=582737 /ORGANISM="Tetraselmis sp., Strain GSL018" /LENGTH=51 /DNA_ID=CAMNT_0019091201 /DNA_START=403 /DNA_END=558 /DNA_ORIENTATION=+
MRGNLSLGYAPQNEMKKRLASKSSGELPEGRPVKDAIDLELEELRKKAKEN